MAATRNPRRILNAWMTQARPVGRPQQTIRISYANTLQNELNIVDTRIKAWWKIARNPSTWAEHVEQNLQLQPGTYTKYKHRLYGRTHEGTQATR